MKILMPIIFLLTFFSSNALHSQEFNKKYYFSSEAVRFAWNGCKRDKNEKACESYERLVEYHKNKPADEVAVEESKTENSVIDQPQREPASEIQEEDQSIKLDEVDKRNNL